MVLMLVTEMGVPDSLRCCWGPILRKICSNLRNLCNLCNLRIISLFKSVKNKFSIAEYIEQFASTTDGFAQGNNWYSV